MTEFNKKSESWRQLKALYVQYRIKPRITYATSNATSINREINYVRENYANLPTIRNQPTIVRQPRHELYRYLQTLNPNAAYRNQSSDDLYRQIRVAEARRRNFTFLNDIGINNSRRFMLRGFFEKPIDSKNVSDINFEDLMLFRDSLTLKDGFYLEMRFNINGVQNYRILKNINELNQVLDLISSGYEVNQPESYGSDAAEVVELYEYDGTVDLTWFNKANYHKTNGGAYFKWFHKFTTYNEKTKKFKLDLDLSRYQVYAQNQKIDDETCIIYTLKQAGISEEKLNTLRLAIVEKHVLFRDLNKIAKLIDINIKLRYHNEKKQKSDTKNINKEAKTVVEIGVVDEHYFINEFTNITASAITYFNQTKNCEYYPEVYLKSPRHSPKKCDKFLTSYQVIRNIYNQRKRWLNPITLTNVNSSSIEKLEEYFTLKAPRKACKCETPEYVDCYFKEEHKIIQPHHCNNDLCKLEYLKEKCSCDSKQYNQYKDYSHRSDKTIFKGKFKESNNPNNNYDLVFLDLETFIRTDKEGYHIPYCLSYQTEYDNTKYSFYGLDCVKQFLDSLKRNVVIITHNLAFDFRGFVDHLSKFSTPIETGTRLKHIQCKYKYNYIVFKDNCAFLPFKLKDLPKMFKLQSGDKDVYPYELINEDNIESFIDIKECNKYIPAKDRKTFELNCKKIGALTDYDLVDAENSESKVFVDIKKYTIHYCNQDTTILKQAYLQFRRQIKKITKLDILELISLPQLADDYFKSQGAYDHTYSVSGVAQDFIRKCAVGGRVMTANNEKHHIKHTANTPPLSKAAKMAKMKDYENCKRISDFDAVSLYPSAMVRLQGYLRGLPKVLTKEEIKNFNTDNYDYYFTEIEILSVGIKRDFSLISVKEDSGIRNFTNDLVGKTFFVDKTALQDLVEFQKITYRVIRGYKFTDGFNNKIVNVINNMFNERMRLKKEKMPDGSEGNPLQQAYKLILNASYGKLIQKPIKTTKVFVEGNYHNYVVRNAKTIDSYTRINQNLILVKKKKSVIEHFTACHLACQVLSMSKRIMNEVMCLAEDNNIEIKYEDTDSIHLYDKNVEELADLFKAKYGRELIGEEMGEFHTDFAILNEDGDKEQNRDKSYPITAVESIFLGKKSYIDKLEYKDKEGNLKYNYHIRMKGLPTSVITKLECNVVVDGKKELKTYESVMDLYTDLYNGACLEFDLAEVCCIKIEKNYRATKTKKFIRKAHFPITSAK